MWTLVWSFSLSEALKRFVAAAPAIEALTRPTPRSWNASGGGVGSRRSIWSLCRRFPTNSGSAESQRRCTEPFSSASLEPGFKWCRLQLVCRVHGIGAPGSLLAPALPLWACAYILLHNPKHSMSNWEIKICNISQTVNSLFVTS